MAQGSASPDDVERAWHDTKLAQVLYHDWESDTYDDKWSISFDDRCVTYARDRFEAVAGQAEPGGAGFDASTAPDERGGRHARYQAALEVGAGTGFFSLNLKQAGILGDVHVTDISPGMVDAAVRNARLLGFEIDGRVADAEELPFADATFDVVVGHAIIHHIPDVEGAFREMLRVLRPGGRVVICGEPTVYGDRIARALSRATWWAATRITRLPPLRDAWARPGDELDESSRAAALESVVDLHTFDPDELAAIVRRAGGTRVRTVTEELTAAWFGWPIRTFEYAVNPERLGWGWSMFAYRTWQRLSAVDRVLSRVVPDELFYNVSVTATRP
ncbi:class I SAM-dependent methyltransferase [Actinobacteria bacterium YIM 96077]|uniref:SAM-dependent methyltransferase n=1 Tax=Phytoactinopolyspora halophila TaxID=1981511 RepID=A0A329QA77_9ACTN|nr:class I SAM-dependent methyltransferase [Phytoactinopolyspora halophila]AYY12372.1 class I SAM-dependent methyltransferase [Actinobacteria bacterium YIM 96077]RAW09223.1 SAM-dependent methyltransferase [Phytoactinopolyspora halophila]